MWGSPLMRAPLAAEIDCAREILTCFAEKPWRASLNASGLNWFEYVERVDDGHLRREFRHVGASETIILEEWAFVDGEWRFRKRIPPDDQQFSLRGLGKRLSVGEFSEWVAIGVHAPLPPFPVTAAERGQLERAWRDRWVS